MPKESLIRVFLKKNPNGITLEQIYQYCVDCGAAFHYPGVQDQKRILAAELTKMKNKGEVTCSGGFWKLAVPPEQPKPKLSLLGESLVVCRLNPDAPIPRWATKNEFFSVTRTRDELSIVCRAGQVPEETRCEGLFRCFKIEGPLDFAEAGIIATVARVLAEAGISIFTISTYDTDYLMVKQEDLVEAEKALKKAGYLVRS